PMICAPTAPSPSAQLASEASEFLYCVVESLRRGASTGAALGSHANSGEPGFVPPVVVPPVDVPPVDAPPVVELPEPVVPELPVPELPVELPRSLSLISPVQAESAPDAHAATTMMIFSNANRVLGMDG